MRRLPLQTPVVPPVFRAVHVFRGPYKIRRSDGVVNFGAEILYAAGTMPETAGLRGSGRPLSFLGWMNQASWQESAWLKFTF